MATWLSRSELCKPSRTVDCTKLWTNQKLAPSRTANGTKQMRNVRVWNRVINWGPYLEDLLVSLSLPLLPGLHFDGDQEIGDGVVSCFNHDLLPEESRSF